MEEDPGLSRILISRFEKGAGSFFDPAPFFTRQAGECSCNTYTPAIHGGRTAPARYLARWQFARKHGFLQPTIDVDEQIVGMLILMSNYLSRATAFV